MQGPQGVGTDPGAHVVAEDARVEAWPFAEPTSTSLVTSTTLLVWQAVTEVVASPVSWVSVIHHGAVESGHDVQIAHVPGSLWLMVDGEVRVSAEYAE